MNDPAREIGQAIGAIASGIGAPGAALAAQEWTLPESGEALRLVEADFVRAANELGVEVAAVHAVAEVEAGGPTGFDENSRPKILFETHRFRENSGGRFNVTHPNLTAPYRSAARRASYQRDQWTVLHEAFALDREAAVQSASWGMFQVLGSNAGEGGWTSLPDFVTDMFSSEAQHMRAFLGHCRVNGLIPYLRNHNWAAFAAGYNGSSYRDGDYDGKLARAYARHSRRTPGAVKRTRGPRPSFRW